MHDSTESNKEARNSVLSLPRRKFEHKTEMMGDSAFAPEWAIIKQLNAHGTMAHAHLNSQNGSDDAQSSFEKIRKQLSGSSETVLLHGPLLKRSETLRKWNQRWFTLDPSTGKMEYRTQRGDATPRGIIHFEANSTITMSPINLHSGENLSTQFGTLDIGTPQKKEYFFCAETPSAAKAWVATLRAVSLVLKAHREAVDSLSGNGLAKTGTVAAAVASANATAREAAKEIQASLQSSMKAHLHFSAPQAPQLSDGGMDDLSIMKETLRVKDEELQQMAKDLRARDHKISELAGRLSDTAEAAEAAAGAATSLNEKWKAATTELEQMYQDQDENAETYARERRAGEERIAAALSEAQKLRAELNKARERILELETALFQSEEKCKTIAAGAVNSAQAAKERESIAIRERDATLLQLELLQGESMRSKVVEQVEGPVSEEKTVPNHYNTTIRSLGEPVDILSHSGGSQEVDVHDDDAVIVETLNPLSAPENKPPLL